MKATKLNISYNTGETELIIPSAEGFIITDKQFVPLSKKWSIEELFNAVSRLLIIGMNDRRDMYSVVPLFEELNSRVEEVKKIISPVTHAKEFSQRFDMNFLYEEIMEDKKLKPEERKYTELTEKLDRFRTKAAEKLTDK